MILPELLREIEIRGVALSSAGDRLRFRPKSRLTPELVEGLREHKAAILEALEGHEVPPSSGTSARSSSWRAPISARCPPSTWRACPTRRLSRAATRWFISTPPRPDFSGASAIVTWRKGNATGSMP